MSPDRNLYELLRSRFPSGSEATAVETPAGEGWTYAELDAESARLANALASAGAEPGDRVAVQVEKSPQALFLYLACLRAGCVYLPLNPAYPAPELEYFFGDARPVIVVGTGRTEAMLRELAARQGVRDVVTLDVGGGGSLPAAARDASARFETVPRRGDDLAAILYTSGTTGRAKGAMLTHSNLASNAETLHRAWGWREGDVLLHALPLFHTHGLFVACHCALLNGSPMILLPKFDVDTVKAELPRASVFMGVPTFYSRLLADPEFGAAQCRSVRLFISGSAPLLPQTWHEFHERTGHTILERYGMTECGMSTSNPLHGVRKPGTVGPPLSGVTLRVVDAEGQSQPPGQIGAIEFKGPNVFVGYWRQPEKTAQEFTPDGFFRSGDLGLIDEDGYVVIVGRDKDLIISGGFNVYPKEVERCIDEIEGVVESAVIGLPDADFGERVTAVVVPRTGVDHPTAEQIIARLKSELASYKVPKDVIFVDEIPRNAMGKVQKNELRELYADLAR